MPRTKEQKRKEADERKVVYQNSSLERKLARAGKKETERLARKAKDEKPA